MSDKLSEIVHGYLTNEGSKTIELLEHEARRILREESPDKLLQDTESIVDAVLKIAPNETDPERIQTVAPLTFISESRAVNNIMLRGKIAIHRVERHCLSQVSDKQFQDYSGQWEWKANADVEWQDFDWKWDQTQKRNKENEKRLKKARGIVKREQFEAASLPFFSERIVYFAEQLHQAADNPLFSGFLSLSAQEVLRAIYEVSKSFSYVLATKGFDEWQLQAFKDALSEQVTKLLSSGFSTRISATPSMEIQTEAADILRSLEVAVTSQIKEIHRSESMDKILNKLEGIRGQLGELITVTRRVATQLEAANALQAQANSLSYGNLVALYSMGSTNMFTGGDFVKTFQNIMSGSLPAPKHLRLK